MGLARMRGAGGEFINKGRGQAGHVTAGGRGRGAEGAGSGGCAGSGREHGGEAPRPIGSSLVSLCGGVFFFETQGADEAQGASPGMRSCLQRKWGRARRSAFRLTLCPMVRTRCGVDEASENEALHRELVGPHVLLSLTFVLQLFKGRMALSWLLSSSGSNRLLQQNVLS